MVRISAFKVFAASIALVVTSAGMAQAQFGGRGPGGGFGMGRQAAGLALIRNEAVQKDLGLTPESVEKLSALAESVQTETRAEMQKLLGDGGFGGFQNLTPEQRQEMQKKMAEVSQKMQEKIQPQLKELLTADQQKRLQQIGYQIAGPAALSDAAVVKELGLSDDQKKQIAQITEESTGKMRELMQGAGGNFQEIGPKIQELNKARDEKVVAVLSAEQKTAFETLKGKPFDVSQLRGGFGAGGGGFGGGRGKPGGAGKPGTGRPARPAIEGKPEAPKQ